MSNNLKYLKDYETSTDYEKFIELLDKGYIMPIELSITFPIKGYASQTRKVIELNNTLFSKEIFSNKELIQEFQKFNLHYIMPNIINI